MRYPLTRNGSATISLAFLALTIGFMIQVGGHTCAHDREDSPAGSSNGQSVSSVTAEQAETCAACQLGRQTRAEGPSASPEIPRQDFSANAVAALQLGAPVATESLPLPRAPPIDC